MNYVDLCAAVSSTVENTFTDADLARFARLVEQKAYTTVQPPALRTNSLGTLASGNSYLSTPPGFLYLFSLATIASGEHQYLLQKDVAYIREAYPSAATTGVPRVYAVFDNNTLIVGPTPDAAYQVEMHYAKYPDSISVAGTSWLGDNFESVLLNGMIYEAARFMKAEEDMLGLYGKMYDESMMAFKMMADGKTRQDVYRVPQAKVQVL